MNLTDIDTALRRKRIKPHGKTASISESLYDAAKELSYYDPVRSNRDLRTGPVPIKDIPTPAGRVARVVKKNLIAPFMDAAQTMGKVRAGKPYTTNEALNFAGTGLVAAMLGGPKTGNVNELAVIKQPPLVTAAIRKVMKQEFKARGPMDASNPIDVLARRTLFRGEKHGRWPEVTEAAAPTFGHKHRTSANFGEPLGVSASLSHKAAVDGFADQYDRVSRAIPLFGGPPTDVILNSMNESGQSALRGAYAHAVKVHFSPGKDRPFRMLAEKEPWRALKDEVGNKLFNATLTDKLKEFGYKGILYHPRRYEEFELKMFDTKDLLHLDMRCGEDWPALKYMAKTTKASAGISTNLSAKAYSLYDNTPELEGTSLGALAYKDLDVQEVMAEHPLIQESMQAFTPAQQRVINAFDNKYQAYDILSEVRTWKTIMGSQDFAGSFGGTERYVQGVLGKVTDPMLLSLAYKELGLSKYSQALSKFTAADFSNTPFLANVLPISDPSTRSAKNLCAPSSSHYTATFMAAAKQPELYEPLLPDIIKNLKHSSEIYAVTDHIISMDDGLGLCYTDHSEEIVGIYDKLFIHKDKSFTPAEVRALSEQQGNLETIVMTNDPKLGYAQQSLAVMLSAKVARSADFESTAKDAFADPRFVLGTEFKNGRIQLQAPVQYTSYLLQAEGKEVSRNVLQRLEAGLRLINTVTTLSTGPWPEQEVPGFRKVQTAVKAVFDVPTVVNQPVVGRYLQSLYEAFKLPESVVKQLENSWETRKITAKEIVVAIDKHAINIDRSR